LGGVSKNGAAGPITGVPVHFISALAGVRGAPADVGLVSEWGGSATSVI
jgi:hypothetical protein